jgi:hypothetical protein
VTTETFQLTSNQRFADNELMKIRPAHFRAFAADIRATFVAQVAPNVPEYDPNYFYPAAYLVVFEGLFYRTKVEGFLPAPTPGQESAEWTPALMPLSPVLPYRELSVQQGQDFGSDGLLEPSKLYRFTGRVDADGAALDDVLVVAVSRHSVAGADAYTIGLDPQTREEQLTAVSYELATDTTSPRTGGGGGVRDAYTKAEADGLLATKGSAQVQAQHTEQLDDIEAVLDTIAGQGKPVYGFLKAGGEPVGYDSLDEALADTRAKISQSFNTPVLLLTQSNAANGAGWAYATSALGRTLQLAEGVALTLPGSNVGTLNFQDFYIEQAPDSRNSKVRLLTTASASTALALLPRLSGYCDKPLEFVNGGAALLTGYYSNLTGTGTAFVLEPFYAGAVATTVKVVRVGGAAMTPATPTALGGLIVGPGLQVDGTGQVSVKIDPSTLGQRADGTLYVPTTSGNISPAATPTNVTAVLSNGGYTCTINWDAKPGATLYQVYRSVNGGPWALVVGVPYNYFVDNSGVTANTFTVYRITAANSTGESAPSVAAQAQ